MISKSEQKMKKILDSVVAEGERFTDSYRPDWLKNPATGQNLELDRYYHDLKIGIEYNVEQHRKKNNEAQWARDKLKKSLCAKHGVIRLVFYFDELTADIARAKFQNIKDMRAAWADGKSWVK